MTLTVTHKSKVLRSFAPTLFSGYFSTQTFQILLQVQAPIKEVVQQFIVCKNVGNLAKGILRSVLSLLFPRCLFCVCGSSPPRLAPPASVS